MRTDEGQDPIIEPTQPQRRPGAELARAREAAGIGLRAMADTLHLPERQVRALENDDYANLPPPTFVRGYLRSYARALGLDADDIVGLYDSLEVELEDPALRLYSDHGDRAHSRGLALAITVLALAVALSLGAWWWQTRTVESAGGSDAAAPAASMGSDSVGGGQGDAVASAAAGTSGASASGESDSSPGNGATQAAGMDDGAARPEGGPAPPTDEANSQTTLTDGGSATDDVATDDSAESGSVAAGATDGTDETSSASANGAGSGGPAGSADSDTTVATPNAADDDGYQPPPQTASAEDAVSPEAAEGPEQLVLNVDGRSWIEIYDARGRELVYTLYTGSEPLRVRGWTPFDVFLGNSPDVSIRFNGEPVAKAGFTRSDNTARFLVDASGANPR